MGAHPCPQHLGREGIHRAGRQQHRLDACRGAGAQQRAQVAGVADAVRHHQEIGGGRQRQIAPFQHRQDALGGFRAGKRIQQARLHLQQVSAAGGKPGGSLPAALRKLGGGEHQAGGPAACQRLLCQAHPLHHKGGAGIALGAAVQQRPDGLQPGVLGGCNHRHGLILLQIRPCRRGAIR